MIEILRLSLHSELVTDDWISVSGDSSEGDTIFSSTAHIHLKNCSDLSSSKRSRAKVARLSLANRSVDNGGS
jgi:hypothetical protein